MIAPGGVIGIVGGGQLGRMTALAAARLGYRCHVLDQVPDGPAAQVAAAVTVADFDDHGAIERFARSVDVATFEFENLPIGPLERIASLTPLRPSTGALAICQDRLAEKRFLEGIGAPVARYWPVLRAGDLAAALADHDGPTILKTTRLGYDGKGQWPLTPEADGARAWHALAGAPGVLEARVAFQCELAVVTARSQNGQQVSYPPVETQHRDQILWRAIAPAPVPAATARAAVQLAERIAAALEIVGVLAVEMFLTRDGELLVNELAPRPHNSGHWTIDACAVSQFEQLVRAICGLPLGDPTPFAGATMDNLLGEAVASWPDLLAEPGARLHLYGKSEVRPGRKLGHVTRLRPKVPG